MALPAAAAAAIFLEFEKRAVRLHREVLMEREATLLAVRSTEKDFLLAADLWRQSMAASVECWSSLCASLVEEVKMACDSVSHQGHARDQAARTLLAHIAQDWAAETDVLRQTVYLESVDRLGAQLEHHNQKNDVQLLTFQLQAALAAVEDERHRLRHGWQQLEERARDVTLQVEALRAQHDVEVESLAVERTRLASLRKTLVNSVTLGSTAIEMDQAPSVWSPPIVLLDSIAALAPRLAVSLDSPGVSCGWIRDTDGVRRLVVLSDVSSTWTISLPPPVDPHVSAYNGAPCVLSSSSSLVNGLAVSPTASGTVVSAPTSNSSSGTVVVANVVVQAAPAVDGSLHASQAIEVFVTVLPPPILSAALGSTGDPSEASGELYPPPPALVRVPTRVVSVPIIVGSKLSGAVVSESGAAPSSSAVYTIELERCPPAAYQQRWELRFYHDDGSAILISTTGPASAGCGPMDNATSEFVAFPLCPEEEYLGADATMDCDLYMKVAGLEHPVLVGSVRQSLKHTSSPRRLDANSSGASPNECHEDAHSLADGSNNIAVEQDASGEVVAASTDVLPACGAVSNSRWKVWPNRYHRSCIVQELSTGEVRETNPQAHSGDDVATTAAFATGTLIPMRTATPILVWLPDGAECVCVVGVVRRGDGLPKQSGHPPAGKKRSDDTSEDTGTSSAAPSHCEMEVVVYALDLEEIVATIPWPDADGPLGGATIGTTHIGFAMAQQKFAPSGESPREFPREFQLIYSDTSVVLLTLTLEWTLHPVFTAPADQRITKVTLIGVASSTAAVSLVNRNNGSEEVVELALPLQ